MNVSEYAERKQTPYKRIYSARWLLVLAFLLCLIAIIAQLDVDDTITWAIIVVASTTAFGFLVALLGQSATNTLWIWTIVFVFLVGYFLKTLLLLWNYGSASFIIEYLSIAQGVNIEDISEGLYWTLGAFGLFCLTGYGILLIDQLLERQGRGGIASNHILFKRPLSLPSSLRAVRVAWISFTVSLISSVLQVVLGIGILGREVHVLPLRFNTVISRSITDLAPALLLLAIWVLDTPITRRWWLMALGLLGLEALLYSLISTSRGGLIRFALPVIFLWILTGRFTRHRAYLLCGLGMVTTVLFPFLSYLRYAAVANVGGLQERFVFAITETIRGGIGNAVLPAVTNIVIRVVGVDGVWLSLSSVPQDFALDRFQTALTGGLTPFYTYEVIGVQTVGDYRAPGLVGAFMLLGGQGGVVLLLVMYLLGLWCIWRLLGKLQVGVLARAIGASTIMQFTSEGTLQLQDILVLLMIAFTCEWIYNHYVTRTLRSISGTNLSHSRAV